MERFVALLAILVIIVNIVFISALVVAFRAIVKVIIIADLAFLRHGDGHGHVAGIGGPVRERGFCGGSRGLVGGIGTTARRGIRAGATLLHGRSRDGGGKGRNDGND